MSGFIVTYCGACGLPFSVSLAAYLDKSAGRQIAEYRRQGFKTAAIENFDKKWCACKRPKAGIKGEKHG